MYGEISMEPEDKDVTSYVGYPTPDVTRLREELVRLVAVYNYDPDEVITVARKYENYILGR